MKVLRARNVHCALPLGVDLLRREGVRQASRVGTTFEHPEPVATMFEASKERVLFWPDRDANPFFHLFECLHMLGGRRDVAWLDQYNRRVASYSDDGEVFHGAYGYRWRHEFGLDQITALINLLQRDPDTRRAVLQMWHAPLDLGTNSRDLPCNTQAYFKIRNGALRMTVACRSNDIIWGAYGANAVHFSFLQEYVANRVGVAVGYYEQISDSFHAYEDTWKSVQELPIGQACPYEMGEVIPYSLGADQTQWDKDLTRFLEGQAGRSTGFFSEVVDPLRLSYVDYKSGKFDLAFKRIEECAATDWRKAAREWLLRRPSFKGKKVLS